MLMGIYYTGTGICTPAKTNGCLDNVYWTSTLFPVLEQNIAFNHPDYFTSFSIRLNNKGATVDQGGNVLGKKLHNKAYFVCVSPKKYFAGRGI